MRYEDWVAEQMKNPEFVIEVEKLKRHLKYFRWYYNLMAWVDYFWEEFLERVSKTDTEED